MRRLASLPLVLALVLASVPVYAGPPEPDASGPIEGPAPPPSAEPPSTEPPSTEPSTETPAEPELVPPPPSIEFAPRVGEAEAGEDPLAPPPSTTPPLSRRDEIGKAPGSGGAFLAGGAWLLPISVGATYLLVRSNRGDQAPPYTREPYIITAGVGLGLIGATMLGMGIHRSLLLRKWAVRHRVIATAQGSALLTSGTLGLLFGLSILIPAAREQSTSAIAVGSVLMASAPIQLGIGVMQARRYQRSGGWRATQYTLRPGGLEIRF